MRCSPFSRVTGQLLFFHYSPLLPAITPNRRFFVAFLLLSDAIFSLLVLMLSAKLAHLARTVYRFQEPCDEGFRRTLRGIIFSQHRDVVYNVNVRPSDYSAGVCWLCIRYRFGSAVDASHYSSTPVYAFSGVPNAERRTLVAILF